MNDLVDRLASDGYALLPDVLDATVLVALTSAIDGLAPMRGTRRVLADPEIRRLGTERLAPIVSSLVEHPLLVRGFTLDKRLDTNWGLPWHRDEQIAVASRSARGSVLEGIPHIVAPRTLLDRMLVLRVHLDACDADRGALVVSPGSHRDERGHDDTRATTQIAAGAGDVLVMRPTLLHRSSKTSREGRRRVIQLEYAPRSATPPAPWYFAFPVARAAD